MSDPARPLHDVVVLAVDGVLAFDLSTPIEVFTRARADDGQEAYRVTVAGPDTTVDAGPIRLALSAGLDRLEAADTVVIPGRRDPYSEFDARAIAAVRRAAARGARVASICVGAFDLAATGLLDGKRATTHWRHIASLRTRHPLVEVDAGPLFVDNGTTLTSAGASTGLDLCVHMVSRDLGAAAGVAAARTAVMPGPRRGRQFQSPPADRSDPRGLARTLAWMERNAAQPIAVTDIAREASMSIRTLRRVFADQVGMSPTEWLTAIRVQRAQRLLEDSDWSMARIAFESGLGTGGNLRRRFAAALGVSPQRYRSMVNGERDD